jgi:hypothetical protein
MNANLANAALNYVAVSSALTKKALDELQVHRTSQQKAAAMRSELLDHMLKAGTVNERTKQAADAMLGSHPETLGLLKSAVDLIAKLKTQLQKQALDTGTGVDPKEAGVAGVEKSAGDYDSLTDPFVGRKTSQVKASDRAIMRVMENPRG